ncbi:Transcriptional coactivator HFI1/ADA1 [Ceratocystis platani]|uniref:Transcriptional coactivator HFI1/ADA1 n=1 Tax=Ceratocystis fimbriata f. sp. platani TaxID=88771 RepID=A0A0F8B5M0_CERFI|nr:Transcriptional coactivator HFI1/ADA1 [Ceratocystis platani]
MPDIDPAALSRPAGGSTTPILGSKSLPLGQAAHKTKTNPLVPPRIDLEPLYVALRNAISAAQWKAYKDAISKFLIGHMSVGELNSILNPILVSPNGEREHLHNRLIVAIYGNVTREMPEPGLAPWVSANDKPIVAAPSKPSSSDAAEKWLKGEIMNLPNRDRRRIKQLSHIETPYDPFESIANAFAEAHRKPMRNADTATTTSGVGMEMNFSNEARKRFAAPLAVESGEFPDASTIESRMLPICYQAGLQSGHTPDSVNLMVNATDTFIKSIIATVLSRTRSNGPGEGSSTGFGMGTGWIQTRSYKRKLHREEEAALRGELFRDKSGLLPIEARAASDREPLSMVDLRLSLDLGDTGLANFPAVSTSITNGYRDGELANYNEYSLLPSVSETLKASESPDEAEAYIGGHSFSTSFGSQATVLHSQSQSQPKPSLPPPHDPMDIDVDITWEGADCFEEVDSLLDACLSDTDYSYGPVYGYVQISVQPTPQISLLYFPASQTQPQIQIYTLRPAPCTHMPPIDFV